MTSRTNFILGISMLIVAATVAFVSSTGDPSSARQAAESDQRPDGERRSLNVGAHDTETNRARAAARPHADGLSRTQGHSAATLTVKVDPSHPEYHKLQPLAAQVEKYARERLARMTADLDFTVHQQQRMFPKLVQASQSYHPGMLIGGVGNALPVEAILDPPQQLQLVESSIDDLMLWREIIVQLESQLDQQTPETNERNFPQQPASEATGGGRNIFEIAPPSE